MTKCVATDDCWCVVGRECRSPQVVVGVEVDGFTRRDEVNEVFDFVSWGEEWGFELLFSLRVESFQHIEERAREGDLSIFPTFSGGPDDDAKAWFSHDRLGLHRRYFPGTPLAELISIRRD